MHVGAGKQQAVASNEGLGVLARQFHTTGLPGVTLIRRAENIIVARDENGIAHGGQTLEVIAGQAGVAEGPGITPIVGG